MNWICIGFNSDIDDYVIFKYLPNKKGNIMNELVNELLSEEEVLKQKQAAEKKAAEEQKQNT